MTIVDPSRLLPGANKGLCPTCGMDHSGAIATEYLKAGAMFVCPGRGCVLFVDGSLVVRQVDEDHFRATTPPHIQQIILDASRRIREEILERLRDDLTREEAGRKVRQ